MWQEVNTLNKLNQLFVGKIILVYVIFLIATERDINVLFLLVLHNKLHLNGMATPQCC
jgi:hypothetical protein